jgi:ubiquitin-protein ligase
MDTETKHLQDEFHNIDKDKIRDVEVIMQLPRYWLFTIKGEYRGYLAIPNEYPAIPPAVNFEDNQVTEGFYIFFKDQTWNPTCTMLDALISIRNYIHTLSSAHTMKLQVVKPNKVAPLEDNKEHIEVPSEEKLKVPDEGEDGIGLEPKDSMSLEIKATKKLFSPVKRRTMIIIGNNDSLLDSSNESLNDQIRNFQRSLIVNENIATLYKEGEVQREEEKQIEAVEDQTSNEDRKEELNEPREEGQAEGASGNQHKVIGEWWYEFRRNKLRNYSEQTAQLKNDKTITCPIKVSTYIQTFYKILILKLGYNPISIIAYFIVSIICFFSIIVILFYILIKEDPNDACSILIVGNFISGMFLIFTLIAFIRQMVNPIFKELSVFTVAIEISARVAYDTTGIFVAVYHLMDHEITVCGTIFLALFISYLCLWYKLEGLRLLIGIASFFLSILNEICVHTCCKPWKGVKASSMTYNPSLQSPKCVICQVEFINQDKLIGLSCHLTHAFHHECLLEWIKYKNECPCCKLLIDKSSHPSLLEVESNQQSNV